MITTITNFGDSIGVLFPKSLLKNVPFSENENVEIHIKDDNIIITRQKNQKHLTTKERIATFYDTTENVQLSEIDWGKPQGKEVW